MAKSKRDLRYGGSMVGFGEIWAIIKSVLKSAWTGNWQAGEQARLMEEEAAKFLGLKYGILTTSGSCAGLLALSALELPRGSEIVISAVTFPTIFNIILQCGHVPVVVDARVGSYTFDVKEVERSISLKTRAIIAIHPCGNPVDMPALMKMVRRINRGRTNKNKIYVIEDNCDGWGSTIKGRKVGSFGDISITSFHAAHIVSMGVGGGIFTNNQGLASNVRIYRDWGRQADATKSNRYKTLPRDYSPRFIYEKIGYNFQILDWQAAMGRVQLRKINKIKEARKNNFDYLTRGLSRFSNLVLPHSPTGSDVCWFSLPLTSRGGDRGELVSYLEKHGIETRSMFAGNIIKHPAYKDTNYIVRSPLIGSNIILENSFWITVHPRLKKLDLDYIIRVFESYYERK